jgi:ketosteroid isomerase-like protein
MKKMLILFLILLASLSIVSAQTSDKITAEFKARQRAEDDAENKRDIAALDHIFADDFIFIGANGSIHDKKNFLDEVKADTSPPSDQKLEYEDFKVRVYGKTAITVYALVVPGKDSQGKATVTRFRMSVLWVKQGKDWRMTNFHATRVR